MKRTSGGDAPWYERRYPRSCSSQFQKGMEVLVSMMDMLVWLSANSSPRCSFSRRHTSFR